MAIDPQETQSICSEWESERNRHPFAVEKLSEQTIAGCWDDSAKTYSGEEYAGIREEMLIDLIDAGILGEDRTMLDIGCGPGLYEKMFSPYVGSICCFDGSKRMIDRLNAECSAKGIDNVSSHVCMWEDFDTDEKYDIVFASLCPPLNNPESLLRMESYSRDTCVYVSSANPTPGMPSEIWAELGKDYSFKGYNTNFPCRYLCSIGRSPVLKFYSEERRTEMTFKEAVSAQERLIRKYMDLTSEVRDIINSVVSSHVTDGVVEEKKTMTLGMLVWNI
ncbi:MAG: class I SAM-dependent methyltransferase [Candidatus Methanoplasma sp.]|jgi:SAM-dependent methyltransferase|nr:class I SAM-dependent methyltransferase [Candidatus Methanoplasma sp.]